MLTELRLSNFQGFAESQRIPLAPISLIYGANSSGKSSIIRALLFLKQSLTGSSNSHSGFVFSGDLIDLGGFKNTVHRHEVAETIGVGLTFDIGSHGGRFEVDYGIGEGNQIVALSLRCVATGQLPAFRGEITPFQMDFKSEELSSERRYEAKSESTDTIEQREPAKLLLEEVDDDTASNLTAMVNEWLFKTPSLGSSKARTPGSSSVIDYFSVSEVVDALKNSLKYTVDDFAFRASTIDENNFRLTDDFEPWNFGDKNDKNRFLANFLSQISRAIVRALVQQLVGTGHISSTRTTPGPLASLNERDDRIRPDGANIVGFLNQDDELLQRVKEAFVHLTDGNYQLALYKVNNKELGFLGEIGSLVLLDKRTNTAVTFKDVGTGLGQILPIVTALLSGRNRRRKLASARSDVNPPLLIEEPEVHLHPKLQVKLAQLLIDSSAARDSEQGKQLIIETHSENIVLRFQKQIRERSLSPGSVEIIYVNSPNESNGSTVKRIEIADNGDILSIWPDDFAVIRSIEEFS